MAKMYLEQEAIDNIVANLEEINENIQFLLAAVDSIEQLLDQNDIPNAQKILLANLKNAREYIVGEYQETITYSIDNINMINDAMVQADEDMRAGVQYNGR